MEKKEKKGFWASLFPTKSCKCSRGNAFAIPSTETKEAAVDGDKAKNEANCHDKKEIMVLGPGCAKCKSTYAMVEKVVKAHGLDAELSKVEDIEEIMRYNIMATPAIVVDGKVVLKGKVPSESEVKQILEL